jgi:hypothetical protein
MKIVINKCYGGFGVSKAVFDELGIPWDGYGFIRNETLGIDEDADYDAYRSDPRLIEAIEAIGLVDASGDMASLRIVDIPDDVKYTIEDYDGVEHIAEHHRTWS